MSMLDGHLEQISLSAQSIADLQYAKDHARGVVLAR